MAGEPESLDTDESLERRRHRHLFDRLIMLSDGVFAIAITLLAFDLRIPTALTSFSSIWTQLGPQLDAYGLSFIVISIYWLAHRRFLAMITTVDAPVTVINLVMLAFVALLPGATQLAEAGRGHGPAMLIYAALVVAIGLAVAALWGYAALVADRVSMEVPRRVRWFLLVVMLFTPSLFLVLVELIPHPTYGVVPGSLILLFLIGWRMRMAVSARLEAPLKPPLAASTARPATP